jgi:hypothetical protein
MTRQCDSTGVWAVENSTECIAAELDDITEDLDEKIRNPSRLLLMLSRMLDFISKNGPFFLPTHVTRITSPVRRIADRALTMDIAMGQLLVSIFSAMQAVPDASLAGAIELTSVEQRLPVLLKDIGFALLSSHRMPTTSNSHITLSADGITLQIGRYLPTRRTPVEFEPLESSPEVGFTIPMRSIPSINGSGSVVFSYFENSKFFAAANTTLPSVPVISASIGGVPSGRRLRSNIVYTLPSVESSIVDDLENACVWHRFSNNSLGSWDSSGCRLVMISGVRSCSCSHLTDFTIHELVRRKKKKEKMEKRKKERKQEESNKKRTPNPFLVHVK